MKTFLYFVIFALVSSAGALTLKKSRARSLDTEKRPKVVFIAGLEGSGHHLLEKITPSKHYNRIEFPGTWQCNVEWQQKEKELFVSQLRNLSTDAIHVLPQQFSYPMCKAGGHEGRMTVHHPRLDWIREATSEAGVSFHVIQLHRSLDDSLASGCLHKKIENCPQQTETLVANGKFLAEHLQQFSPDERLCFRYSDAESMEKALVSAFGKQAKELVADVYYDQPPKKNAGQREELE